MLQIESGIYNNGLKRGRRERDVDRQKKAWNRRRAKAKVNHACSVPILNAKDIFQTRTKHAHQCKMQRVAQTICRGNTGTTALGKRAETWWRHEINCEKDAIDTWITKKAITKKRWEEAGTWWIPMVTKWKESAHQSFEKLFSLGEGFSRRSSGWARHVLWVDGMSRKQQRGRSSSAADWISSSPWPTPSR